jgi:hypothetical protein
MDAKKQGNIDTHIIIAMNVTTLFFLNVLIKVLTNALHAL